MREASMASAGVASRGMLQAIPKDGEVEGKICGKVEAGEQRR